MNITVKVSLQKQWTLLEDRLIVGDKEIMLSDITKVKSVFKPTFMTNGVIEVTYNSNSVLHLSYDKKTKSEGEQALKYIEENCGGEILDAKTARIRSEIERLPYKDTWGTRKEINELPSILGDDESIKAMTSGFTDGNTWLMVCTNKRVLLLDKGMIYGIKTIDIALDKINSVSHTKGLLMGKIAITDGATTRTIENISNSTVTFFTETIKEQIEAYKNGSNSVVTSIVNTVSAADELLKYKQLLDAGVLTQEEFDTKKKELLNM